jgi:type VII secretion integral membrane protein EccD
VDEQCRITVVGERRQADLVVPAAAPIASYVNALARVCGQDGDPVLLSAWSLGPAAGSPFAPEHSLDELGVLDGSVLYLRDIVADEFYDPVVYDVAERVAEVATGWPHHRWTGRTRNAAVVSIGVGWLVATLTALAVRHQVGQSAAIELAALFGLMLPMVGWLSAERGWPVQPRLRESMALSAVPLLALVAWLVSASHSFGRPTFGDLTADGLTAAALTVGALAGATVAYAAVPSAATCTALLTAVVAAAAGVGLAAAKADGITAATVTAVIAFALLTVAPKVAARAVAFAGQRAQARRLAGEAGRAADPIAAAVSDAATVLIAWSGALAAVLAVTLVLMAASRTPYAAAAAACLSLGLLLRAGTARLTAEVVPLLVAGAAGLLTLLIFGPGNLGWPGWVAPSALPAVGVILVGFGLRRLILEPDVPEAPRPGWLGGLGSTLGGGGVVLAVAALGAFVHLVSLGHHL